MNNIFSQIKIQIDEFLKNNNFIMFKNADNGFRKIHFGEHLKNKITKSLKKLIKISKNLKDKTNGKICFDNDLDKLLLTINSIFEEANNKLINNEDDVNLWTFLKQFLNIKSAIINEYYLFNSKIERWEKLLEKTLSHEPINFETKPENIKISCNKKIIATDDRSLYYRKSGPLRIYHSQQHRTQKRKRLNRSNLIQIYHPQQQLDFNKQSDSITLESTTTIPTDKCLKFNKIPFTIDNFDNNYFDKIKEIFRDILTFTLETDDKVLKSSFDNKYFSRLYV